MAGLSPAVSDGPTDALDWTTVRIKYLDSDHLPRMKKVWWYGYGQAFTDQMEGFVNMQFDRNIAGRLVGAIRAAGVFLKKGKL